jgi:predicted RNA-binding protein with RPS1 domain
MLQQSFEPPDAEPICIELVSAEDGLVETSEILTIGVQSSDEAVNVEEENTAQVTVLDVSSGKINTE